MEKELAIGQWGRARAGGKPGLGRREALCDAVKKADSRNVEMSRFFKNLLEFTGIHWNLLEFGFFKKCATDPRMNQWTDGRTNRRTNRLIELHFATKNLLRK